VLSPLCIDEREGVKKKMEASGTTDVWKPDPQTCKWLDKRRGPFASRFVMRRILGEGADGVVVAVDMYNERNERMSVAMKISGNNTEFKQEVIMNRWIARELIAPKVCPNFNIFYGAFTCDDLPPRTGKWAQLHVHMGSLGFEDRLRRYERGAQRVGYMLLEFADREDLVALEEDRYYAFALPLPHLRMIDRATLAPLDQVQRPVKEFIFQMMYASAALNRIGIHHMDMRSENVLATNPRVRKIPYRDTLIPYAPSPTEIRYNAIRMDELVGYRVIPPVATDNYYPMPLFADFGRSVDMSASGEMRARVERFQNLTLPNVVPEQLFVEYGQHPVYSHKSEVWVVAINIFRFLFNTFRSKYEGQIYVVFLDAKTVPPETMTQLIGRLERDCFVHSNSALCSTRGFRNEDIIT
jgi:serine/threonine protein kinase